MRECGRIDAYVAAVEVSLASIYKGAWQGSKELDGKKVDFISTYFDDQIFIGNPYPLAENVDRSFIGSYVLGLGFTLSPQEAHALIAKNPKNKEVLFPYLNGQDLNSHPEQEPSRWVINFFDWQLNRETASKNYTGPVATDYPDCLAIVEEKVKPERTRKNEQGKFILRKPLPQRWWHYADKRPALYQTIAPLERVMVSTRVTKTFGFSRLSLKGVASEATVVIALEDKNSFCVLNSSFHEFWAWKNCTTMKTDLNYTPTKTIETFPFPAGFAPNPEFSAVEVEANLALKNKLEDLGLKLDTSRRLIMNRLNIGLTKLYNLFHSPALNQEQNSDTDTNLGIDLIIKTSQCTQADAVWALTHILTLRETHRLIDLAVLESYGWQDIPLGHGFHSLEFLPENDRTRYTISTPARKLLLTELLKLNHTRHAQELSAGLVDEKGKILKKKGSAKKTKPSKPSPGQNELF